MKPGDLVEFKSGLFGIEAPKNLGIYLDRVKRKGSFFIVLYTLKGERELKPDNVTGRRFQGTRLDPPFEDAVLKERLDGFIREFASGGGKQEKPQVAPGEMNDRVLWNKVWEAGEQSPDEMAARYFATPTPTRQEVGQVRNVLASCARPGVGYFERLPGRGEVWRPLTLDEFKAIKREEEGLNKLRKKLVRVIEEEDPETERIVTRYEGVRAPEANLDEDDRRRLALVERVMGSFVHHDEHLGDVGLAGTAVHTIDGFNLFGWTRWLALDWTGSARTGLSSAFVEFLIGNDVWTVPHAIERIAKRKVAQHPDFSWEPDEYAERAADRFTEDTVAAAKAGRVDLTDLATWTIDPPEAKDHDDAISFEVKEDGSRVLWIHIADVAHYVEKDGTIDRSARQKATSVYLPTGVLPMLPKKLSNELCSLNEGVDRLAMTVKVVYDADANVESEDVMESVVRVTGNVSYDEVLAEVEAGDDSHGFVALEAFARELDRKRRGLVLETGERRIRLTPEEVHHSIKAGNRATKMIEVFMVTANEAVARKLTAAGIPLPYRCHPLPDRVSVERFNKQMQTMELELAIELPSERASAAGGDGDEDEDGGGGGASILDQLKKGGKLNLFGTGGMSVEGLEPEEPPEDPDAEAGTAGDAVAPAPVTASLVMKGLAQLTPEEQDAWLAPFRDVLEKVRVIKDERLRDLVYLKTLSCMGRAIYTPANLGHFGLGSTCYCHFTSPIRRYPDVVVHRQLKALIHDEEPPHAQDIDDISIHCSEQGAAADGLERQNVDTAMVFVSMQGGWEGAQSGIVNGITKGGVFLSLPRGLEARLATSDIPGGPWSVDDADSMLFAGSADRAEIAGEVTAKNWRELYNPDKDEIVKVRVRLGDDLDVAIAGRDFVDGKVSAKLAGEVAEE